MRSEELQVAARREAVAIPDITGLVWVRGNDAAGFLEGLLSQNIASIDPGETRPSLLLEPNGKLRAPLLVMAAHDGFGLLCDAPASAAVADGLQRFKIRVDVSIAIDDAPAWDIWGMQAAASIGNVPAPGRWVDGDRRIVPRPFLHGSVPRIVVVGEPPPVPRAEPVHVDAVRIEAGEPRLGVDLSDNVIPQEFLDVSDWVDFEKGCYLGQELVARIDSRGHVNRRLAGFVFADQVPRPGVPIIAGGEEVGTLTSSAFSLEVGSGVGLALIRVEAAVGTAVQADGIGGVVADLPLA